MHVLVTRPQGQQQALVEALQRLGLQVSHQAALRIEALEADAVTRQRVMNLDQYDVVFVVSRNAARFGISLLQDYWPQWPQELQWIAVGDATATLLQQAGLAPLCPAAGFNSEAVLALPALAEMRGRRVLILRGDQGRELFADTLRTRGAEVDALNLYQRRCNKGFCWPEQAVDIVLVTSVESWQCLLEVCAVPPSTLVIAGAERIADEVRGSGHQRVLASASPRDEDMLKVVRESL